MLILGTYRRRWEEKGLKVTVDVLVRADRESLMATVKATIGGKLDMLVSIITLYLNLKIL